MKKRIVQPWALAVLLATLPLSGGLDLEIAQSAPAPIGSVQSPTNTLADITNAPSADVAEQQLENASGRVISIATPAAAKSNISAPAAEVAKLANAGVDEGVMLSYVTNSPLIFRLSSDDIVYLSDIGVPPSVVTAMIQHDQAMAGSMAMSTTVTETNLPGFPGVAPTPYPEVAETEMAVEPAMEEVPLPEDINASYSYFYDSLAPYGNWIQMDGYGLCWQPTVVVANSGWSPYCDRGRWTYTDCGWYWNSDYSWGWAPFHYGRWFRHARWGWCWAPDTVWGPSWVTWRYGTDYCGWAPLPPTACYGVGRGFTYFGRSVGIGFGFGLQSDHFTFVAANRFTDSHLSRHRLGRQHVRQIFNTTVGINQIVDGRHNRVINAGIPVRYIADASRTPIRPIPTRDASSPLNARSQTTGGSAGRELSVFRPNLPAPSGRTTLVGEGVRPATRNEVAPRTFGIPRNAKTEPLQPFATTTPVTRNPVANVAGTPASNPQGASRPQTGAAVAGSNQRNRNAPLILRGSDQPAEETVPPRSVILRGNRNANQAAVANPNPYSVPSVPGQHTAPFDDDAPRGNRNVYSVPRQTTAPSMPAQSPVQMQPPMQSLPPMPAQSPRSYRSDPPVNVRQEAREFVQPAPQRPAPNITIHQPESRPQQRAPDPPPQVSRPDPPARSEVRQAPAPTHSSPPPQQQQQSAPARQERSAPGQQGGGGPGPGRGR